MGVMYIIVAIIVLILNIGNLGHMFGMIFSSAFDFEAIFGGFAGSCIMYGVKRGLYSNEAGMGSAPNAAATADVSHPAKQGLVQMLSVFIDTLLICSATALMCLSTNVMPADYATKEPIEFVQDSMSSTLGSFGPVFVTVALTLFAFTTLIGNYSYCEGCLKFILKKDPSPAFLTVFRLVASAIILLGAISSANLVWDTADMAQGLMVVTNVPSILILGSVALKCFKDYERQRKEGKNPVFKAANIGLFDKLDFWQ
jgi:AGCS family alanine or glycine:cation symporter